MTSGQGAHLLGAQDIAEGDPQQQKQRSEVYQLWLSKVRKEGWVLRYAPMELRSDKYIVLEAVRHHLI